MFDIDINDNFLNVPSLYDIALPPAYNAGDQFQFGMVLNSPINRSSSAFQFLGNSRNQHLHLEGFGCGSFHVWEFWFFICGLWYISLFPSLPLLPPHLSLCHLLASYFVLIQVAAMNEGDLGYKTWVYLVFFVVIWISCRVGSPGASKNALTVGASSFPDHEVLVYFSSIGYDYDNHMFKPNVVTPGTKLMSTGWYSLYFSWCEWYWCRGENWKPNIQLQYAGFKRHINGYPNSSRCRHSCSSLLGELDVLGSILWHHISLLSFGGSRRISACVWSTCESDLGE